MRRLKNESVFLKKSWIKSGKKGITQVYFFGSDEAHGEELKIQRKIWKKVHQAGGKIAVACSLGFFPLVGDLLDLPIINKQSPEELKESP